MKIDFEGRIWDLELDDVSIGQCEAIAGHTGLSPAGWYAALLNPESPAWLKSVQSLYWLMREQNGEPVPLDANFAPLKLFNAFAAAAGAAADSEAAAGT